MITAFIAAALLQATGPWTIIDRTSALDGARTYMAGVQSSEGATLSISCINRQRQVSLTWPTYMGYGDAVIHYRIGQGEVRREQLEISRDGRMVQMTGRMAERFMSEMEGQGSVVIRVQAPTQGGEATFDVTGGEAPLAEVRTACPSRR